MTDVRLVHSRLNLLGMHQKYLRELQPSTFRFDCHGAYRWYYGFISGRKPVMLLSRLWDYGLSGTDASVCTRGGLMRSVKPWVEVAWQAGSHEAEVYWRWKENGHDPKVLEENLVTGKRIYVRVRHTALFVVKHQTAYLNQLSRQGTWQLRWPNISEHHYWNYENGWVCEVDGRKRCLDRM